MELNSGHNDDILLVEDHPGDVRLIEEALDGTTHDATLHTVSTVDAALDFVNRRGEYADAPEPDLMLLDWNLPQTNGGDVLDTIKTEYPHISVVVMTELEANEVARNSLTAEPDAFITKPTDPEEYIEALCSID